MPNAYKRQLKDKNGDYILPVLGTNNVETANITDNAVTTAKINGSAVTTAKIADKNVTTAKIADNAVISTNIAKDTVRYIDFANGKATVIANSTNLNTVAMLKVGQYYINSDANAKTLVNAPTASAFTMRVYNSLDAEMDNETTRTYVYRVREITDRFGYKWVQYAESGSTAGTFTYGPWVRQSRNNFTLTTTDPGEGADLAADQFIVVYKA